MSEVDKTQVTQLTCEKVTFI